MKTNILYKLDWIESEAGWGTRPDGYSLHKSRSDASRFVKEYWDRMPDEAPREYSAPVSTTARPVSVQDDIYKKVDSTGVRVLRHNRDDYPYNEL